MHSSIYTQKGAKKKLADSIGYILDQLLVHLRGGSKLFCARQVSTAHLCAQKNTVLDDHNGFAVKKLTCK